MKLFKILTTVILASLASAASAQSTAPLTFGDSDTDEDNWNYLMHFKLWGTEGISFGNRPEFSDTQGWVGTAAGDLKSLGYGGSIGGPIIVGGSISGTSIQITTGPIRSDGTITAQMGNGIVKCSSTDLSNECSTDKVPGIRSNLKVPTLPENIPWPSGITVPSQKTSVINIDTMCPETDVCDIFYESISIENDGVLIVSMPDGGRPTRIFTKSLNMATHPKIAVRYTNKGNLESSDYEGNLLIYVDNDINFVNTDNSTIMGTFVSTGTIKLTCNIVFVGQMIANNLIIGNEIDGSHFRFMPFKGSDNSLSLLGNRANIFEENDTWQTVNLGLNNAAKVDVTFDYCFEFFSATGVQNTYAGYQDVAASDASHKFPICNKGESAKATIKVGYTKAEGIYIKPLLDGYVEKDESLWLQINNLEGAKLASNYEDGKGYKINIVSNDKLPTVSSELVISVNEDSKHTFTSSEFKFQHASQKLASVIITSIPAKGSLTLNGTAVKVNTTIAVANLSKFTYTPAANDFGNSYTTFKYKVVGDGTGDNTSVEYNATVNVIPVNDKPTAAETIFYVNELDHAVSGGPITVTDVSNERDKDTYAYSLVNESNSDYTAFNQLFEISKLSNQNATIKVKSGAKLDYSQKKEYSVYVNIKDNAATETQTVNGPQSSGLVKVTVKIINENNPPTINNQTFSISEKSSDGSDWPSGKTVGTVLASDSDGDPLTFSIATTGVPFTFKNGTNWLIVSDGSTLNYEAMSSWTFKVVVSDDQGGSATANVTVNITDVNDAPTYEYKEYAFEIHESAPKGEFVGSVVAEDEDTWSKLTYTISDYVANSKDSEVFKIDSKTGKIYLNASIDYETKNTYEILAKATDNGKDKGFENYSATALVTINVIDIDEPSSSSSSVPSSSWSEAIGSSNSSTLRSSSSSTAKSSSSSKVIAANSSSSRNDKASSSSYNIAKSSSSSAPSSSWSEAIGSSNSSTLRSSSSTIAKSSSSSKTIAANSSSSRNDKTSSSSYNNAKSSSSSAPSSSWSEATGSSDSSTLRSSSSTIAKSSSSSKVIATNSSSSRNDKKSSSSSKISDDEIPDFYVRMTGAFEFEIVMDESVPSIAKKYAVMDMKGQVLTIGELNDKNAYVKVPTRGAYIVKVGLGYRRINVR